MTQKDNISFTDSYKEIFGQTLMYKTKYEPYINPHL